MYLLDGRSTRGVRDEFVMSIGPDWKPITAHCAVYTIVMVVGFSKNKLNTQC